jgi:hypothetical protein
MPTTPAPLICERCKTEILPGSAVEFVGLDEDARIVMSEDLLVMHAVCPSSEPYRPTTAPPGFGFVCREPHCYEAFERDDLLLQHEDLDHHADFGPSPEPQKIFDS